MKALVYRGPEQIDYADVADPVPGPGEVVVRVAAVGICGSDMHAYLGHDERRPAPLILGHEAAGVVESGPTAGRRVVVNPLVSCGTCPACMGGRANLCPTRQIISMPPRQGAFAERIVIPERNLVDVPDGMSMSRAALAEPLATAWHALRLAERHSERPVAEASALILGAGAVGLGAALSARAFGARHITVAETNPLRRATAANAGFEHVVDAAQSDAIAQGSADVVIDAVGNKATRKLAVLAAKPGAVIVHIGLGDGVDGFDARRLTLQEITLVGAYTYTMADFRATVAAMASGALGTFDWTEERPLADGAGAFRDLLAGRAAAAKIVLHPSA